MTFRSSDCGGVCNGHHPMSLSRPVSTIQPPWVVCHCRVVPLGPQLKFQWLGLRVSALLTSPSLQSSKKTSCHHFRFWNNLELWRTSSEQVRNTSINSSGSSPWLLPRDGLSILEHLTIWTGAPQLRVNHMTFHDIPWHVLTRRESTMSVMSVSSSRRDWFWMFSKASPTVLTTETWLKPHRNSWIVAACCSLLNSLLQLVAPRCVGVPLKRPVPSGANPSWIIRRQRQYDKSWPLKKNNIYFQYISNMFNKYCIQFKIFKIFDANTLTAFEDGASEKRGS